MKWCAINDHIDLFRQGGKYLCVGGAKEEEIHYRKAKKVVINENR